MYDINLEEISVCPKIRNVFQLTIKALDHQLTRKLKYQYTLSLDTNFDVWRLN